LKTTALFFPWFKLIEEELGLEISLEMINLARSHPTAFKKLFNAARAHFNPVGGRLVGTGKARQFFVDQGLDNSDTQRWWFRLQLNMRRSITERMVRVSFTYCVRDLNLLKLLRFIFCKQIDFTGRQSLALALSFTINKYSGTNVTVIVLPRESKGSLEILTWWLLGTEWRGA
jgi:hypothetical protein